MKLPGGGSGRADYVILRDGKPAIVIECKAASVTVDESVSDQMRDYATALGAAVGVATNGYAYACYADIDTVGTIDVDPFCFAIIQTLTADEQLALELLSKTSFAPDRMRTLARQHKQEFERQSIADAFVWAPAARDELLRIGELKGESDRNEELSRLLANIGEQACAYAVEAIARRESYAGADDEIVTTGEELDAYCIVKGILHGLIDPERIDFRDRRTYASVLDRRQQPQANLPTALQRTTEVPRNIRR